MHGMTSIVEGKSAKTKWCEEFIALIITSHCDRCCEHSPASM